MDFTNEQIEKIGKDFNTKKEAEKFYKEKI